MTFLLFLCLILILVIVHELGHFLTAKLFDVKVKEFGVGFPPKLIGRKIGETEYTINAIPLGGFVKLEGETGSSEDPRSLSAKPPWQRAIIISAGSIMNFLLAVIILTGFLMIPQHQTTGEVYITEIQTESPAESSGLQVGDRILYVGETTIDSLGTLRGAISQKLGSKVPITISANGTEKKLEVLARWNPPEGQGAIGVVLELRDPHSITKSYPIWSAFPRAFNEIGTMLSMTGKSISSWAQGDSRFPGSGPIGMVKGTHEIVDVAGLRSLIPLAAFLSVSLSIFNILPIPALDGGRLLFVVIEVLRKGKKIPPDKEGMIHMLGFAILIASILLISYNDILKIIRGESFFR
jgi:regulator of sigma E protease